MAGKRLNRFYIMVRLLTFLILVTAVLYIIFDSEYEVSRGLFIAIQSVVILILSFVPSFVEGRLKLEIPGFMKSIYLIFVLAAQLFGEIAGFFVTVSWWDDLLHAVSGLLISIVGFSILNAVDKSSGNEIKLNPFFIAFFVFCFSMTIAVIWEFIEFSADYMFVGSNMMRTVDSITLIPHQGLDAVFDTMHDLLLAAGSSLLISILGYFDAKNNLSLFDHWIIKSKRKQQ